MMNYDYYDTDNPARAEWDQWQAVCRLLTEAGAVNADDLQQPWHSTTTTGQRLLTALRAWGDLRVALALAAPPKS